MLEPRQNRSSGCWKRKTRLEKTLIPCCLLLCAVTVLVLILYVLKTPESDPKDICTSKYCVKSSAELLDYADFKENPCQDFYKYVCGSFYKHAVKRQATTPLVTLTDELENELKAIVVDPIGNRNPPALISLKQFYQQCMDEKKIHDDHSKAFLKAVDELGGWPLMKGDSWSGTNFDWVDWQIKASQLGLPIYGFFTFRRVTTGAGSTILKVLEYSNEANLFVLGNRYNRVMLEVLEALGVEDKNGTIEKQNGEVHEFMQQIGSLSIPETRDLKVKTLKDIQEDCPSVPWLKLMNSLANGQTKFDNKSEVVYGSIQQYCDKLDALIKKTSPRTVANYFVWSLLDQTYNYLSIRKTYAEMEYTSSSRFEICYDDVNKRFQYVKDTVYIRKKTPKVVRDDLSEMIDMLKEVFIEHVKASDWMDAKTKDLAVKKTEQIESMIGGDDEMYEPEFFEKALGIGEVKPNILNYDTLFIPPKRPWLRVRKNIKKLEYLTGNMFEMSRQKSLSETKFFFKTLYLDNDDDWDGFFENMLQVNAFFVPPLNVMILPAPILNSIFYDHRKPAFMNYGSIGRVIGHEIMHGFEKSARYVVSAGSGMIDWWTNETADAYDKKVKCVVENYEKIPFRYRLNGTLTLDENVSDFVGMDVAYEAYLKYVKKHGPEKGLPGIPLKPEQIFWIQTGTWLCFRKLDDSDVDYEEEDEHAIPGFRVQGGARNSLYFSKDFNCPEGSFMNPEKKCRIL